MFTIEHEFDATVVTLVDEGQSPLSEDVVVTAFEDEVTLTQYDPRTDQDITIRLSMTQVKDIGAALDLPEGMYSVKRD